MNAKRDEHRLNHVLKIISDHFNFKPMNIQLQLGNNEK